MHSKSPGPVGRARMEPASLSDRELTDRLSGPLVRCATGSVNPDDWFPVAIEPQRARRQGAAALALCETCALRAECLEVSMRQWDTVGRHGIWGGFVEAERIRLQVAWRAGIPATALVRFPSTGSGRISSPSLRGGTGAGSCRPNETRPGEPASGGLGSSSAGAYSRGWSFAFGNGRLVLRPARSPGPRESPEPASY
jgi:hypothetical protein